MRRSIIALIIIFLLFPSHSRASWREKVPDSIMNGLSRGEEREVIILLDDSALRESIREIKGILGLSHDTEDILGMRHSWYGALKADILSTLPAGGFDVVTDYSHLPMIYMKLRSFDALESLMSHPSVLRAYENRQRYPVLNESLPLINQPSVYASGKGGAGTTVSVIDTGVDYRRPEFGSCASPGDGCKVIYARDFAPDDRSPDDNGHGTNVAAIVIGVAPDTRIAALDVFNGDIAYDSDIISAINWSISNRAAYNIVSMNLSLGDGLKYTSPCTSDVFAVPISNARSAGIIATIASGNEGYTNGISSPACVPGAVSVGAVYDSNLGSIRYPNCIDSTTSPDKVACFSNSSDLLTILAPGALITAGGYTMAGTSQAAPHIAGAIAVLRADDAFPLETVDETISRMTSTGVNVKDIRNNITKPRIDLLAASSLSRTYTISGRVLKKSGWNYLPLVGVTVTLSGASNKVTVSDSIGNYSFTGLSKATYTVTPSLEGYVFSPSSMTITINGSDVTDKNFIGTYVGTPTYSISGKVTSGGNPLVGVMMSLSGTRSAQTTTDINGNYSFSSLPDGTYTITPSMSGYIFNPSSITVNISGSNAINQNFTATLSGSQTYSISGRVYMTLSWGRVLPLSGVTMTMTGLSSAITTTDSNGYYSFTGLTNGTYTIRPSKTGYTFIPSVRTVNINGSNALKQDFLAR